MQFYVLLPMLIVLGSCRNVPRLPASIQTKAGADVPAPQALVYSPSKQNQIFESMLAELDKNQCRQQRSSKPKVRLLSNEEVRRSITSIFPNATQPESKPLGHSIEILGFAKLDGYHLLSPDSLDTYLSYLEKFSKTIEEDLERNFSCTKAFSKDCLRVWLSENLDLIWRRQVLEGDIDQVLAEYEAAGSMDFLIKRIFSSAYFLYQDQASDSSVYQKAAKFSFSLWGQIPTRQLLRQIESANSDESILEFLFSSEKLWDGLDDFAKSWLGTTSILEKDLSNINASVDPMDLAQESTDFFYYLLDQGEASFTNLMEADYFISTESVANMHSLSTQEVVNIAQRSRSKLSFDDNRRGLLSQPGLITSLSPDAKTHLAKRANFLLSKFYCHQMEAIALSEDDLEIHNNLETLSERQTLEELTKSPSCSSCHDMLNPLAFSYEGFDAYGFYRQIDDKSQPVNTRITMPARLGDAIELMDLVDLSQHMSKSKRVKLCYTTQVFRQVFSRLEEEKDICLITQAYKSVESSDHSLNEIYRFFLNAK